MSLKCVHKGCGKKFDDPEEECIYHSGPPIFHEGQKGWTCCKPRVLTFDEFLSIPPCTIGKHSTVDDSPPPPPKPTISDDVPDVRPVARAAAAAAMSKPMVQAPPKEVEPEPERNDPPDATIAEGTTCLRSSCEETYKGGAREEDEQCKHHAGKPIFHEGTKGWSCCKKRVLAFDEFLEIPGCTVTKKHLFTKEPKSEAEEMVESVRNDYYQSSQAINLSFYLKGVLPKGESNIEFSESKMEVDFPTKDKKRYKEVMELFADILPDECKWTVMGTKVDVTLRKKDVGLGWPALRKDQGGAGMILQVGRAGVAR